MSKSALLLLLFPLALPAQFSATLSPRTTEAFEAYLRTAEPQIQARGPRYGQLRPGDVQIVPAKEDGSIGVKDGIVHDWVAAVLIPGATVEQALGVLQNYPSYKNIYAPEVTDSRLIARNGDQWRVYLQIVKKKVLTAVLNTEYEVNYKDLGGRWTVTSRSTRIAEVDEGKELPLGTGHGFLWRLNAYWLIEPRPNGVYLECRSISLSRDIPFGLGFAVGPFVKSLPIDSLRATMDSTARALGRAVASREHPTVAQNKIDDGR